MLIYLIIILVTGFMAIMYNVYFTGVLFLVSAIMPMVFFAFLCFTAWYVDIRLEAEKKIVTKQEDGEFYIGLSNRSPFPVTKVKIYLTLTNCITDKKIKQKIDVPLDENEERKICCKYKMLHCGEIMVTIQKVKLYDWMGLFHITRRRPLKMLVYVLPPLSHIDFDRHVVIRNDMIESENFSKTNRGDDPSEVFDIREYRDGDRIHTIHWKLSHKYNKWMVKEFSLPIISSILVLLEIPGREDFKNAADVFDSVMETGFSTVWSLMETGQRVNLGWYVEKNKEYNKREIVKEEDLFEVMEEILAMKTQVKTNEDLFSDFCAQYGEFYNIIYVTGLWDKNKTDKVQTSIHNGAMHVIYVTDYMNENPEELETGQIIISFVGMQKEENIGNPAL